MFKIQIVDYVNNRCVASNHTVTVGRNKHVGFQRIQHTGNLRVEPKPPQKRMAGLKRHNDWLYVVAKNKILAVHSVEQQIKLMLGMVLANPFNRFVGEPRNPVDSAFDE